ncbi:TolC family protein [Nostoc sp. NIES-2111]
MDSRFARYSAYFLILLGLAGGPAAAQQTRQTYTIQDCIETALKNNIDAQNSALDAENARLAYRNSYGQKIPTLSLNGSQSINAGYTVDPYTNQFVNQTIRSNNFSVNSNLTLFSGNQINRNHQRLNSAWQASQYSQQVTRNQVTLEVAQYYTALLSAYKVEAAARSRLTRAQKDRERIQRRIEAKAAAKSELADADASVATEELNLSRASGDITRQKLLLAQRMLIKDMNFEVAVPNVDVLLAEPADTDVARVYEAALQNMPETKLARQNVRTNRYAEKAAHGAYLPTITANGNVTTGYSSARTRTVVQNGSGNDKTFYLRDTTGIVLAVPSSLFGNSRTVFSEKYPFRDQFSDNINKSITFQASIPILNRLSTKGNIDAARINRLKAENEVARSEQALYNNVALAVTEYTISKANLLSAQRQMASLQTSLQAAQTRYEAGAGSMFDLLTQQQLFAASQANLVQTQFDLVFRKLVIDYYMGKPIKL